MSFLDLVKKRKSCRKYLPKEVPRDKIERCLEAARLAPSACNSQPWYFIVVDNPEIKAQLGKEAFSGAYNMNSFAKEAPVLVVFIREMSKYAAIAGGFIRGLQYSLVDEGIAIEHFILQAEEEGLSSCWLGWFNEKSVKKILKIPRKRKIDTIISLGYARDVDGQGELQKNRKTIEQIREYR